MSAAIGTAQSATMTRDTASQSGDTSPATNGLSLHITRHLLPSVSTMLCASEGIGVGSVKIRSRPCPLDGGWPLNRPRQGTMKGMERNPAHPADGSAGYRALVVDDEVPLAERRRQLPRARAFRSQRRPQRARRLALAREIDPDVVVLDLGAARHRRPGGVPPTAHVLRAYVVMLTARDTEMDTSHRFVGRRRRLCDQAVQPPRTGGADSRDVAQAAQRGGCAATGAVPDQHPPRVFGELRIDVAGREVFIDDEPITLTRTEFDVLAALSARPGVVFSRRQLLDAVWAESWGGNEHLVDVHVGHLRRKLGDDPAAPRYVITVRGVGYRMGSGK